MSKRYHRGFTYQSRNPLAAASPLRSIPLYRSIQSVFGPTPRVRAEAGVRIATDALTAELEAYKRACMALGEANRRPVKQRRWWQGQAMRMLNGRRKHIRAARSALAAAQAVVAALKPVDDYATLWMAEQAGVVVAQPVVPFIQGEPQPAH